ncbi:MAG: Fur family transcriptional regulator [Candidatus Moraniibacteriota bacterium]
MLKDCLLKLEKNKVKVTPLRCRLLELFHASDAPLSIPDLQKRLEAKGSRANKTSVYRNLELLEMAGVVEKVSVSDESRYYELMERTHHHHLVCLSCERIFDIPIQETKLLQTVDAFSKKLQFTISRHAVEFYGLCSKCQGRKISRKAKIRVQSH